jgi:hypothetical protein
MQRAIVACRLGGSEAQYLFDLHFDGLSAAMPGDGQQNDQQNFCTILSAFPPAARGTASRRCGAGCSSSTTRNDADRRR